MMQEIVKENRQIAINKLNNIKNKAQKEKWELDELNYVISMFEKRLKDKSQVDGFSALRIPIKLDVLELDQDELTEDKDLLQAVDTAVEMNENKDFGIPVPDYIEENVSTKVVKIIQSYTGVVNKMVWRK